jgi:hypothetical protein
MGNKRKEVTKGGQDAGFGRKRKKVCIIQTMPRFNFKD